MIAIIVRPVRITDTRGGPGKMRFYIRGVAITRRSAEWLGKIRPGGDDKVRNECLGEITVEVCSVYGREGGNGDCYL